MQPYNLVYVPLRRNIWVFIQSFAVMKMMTPSWGTRNLGESCKSLMKQDYYYQLNTKEMKHHRKLSETFPFPTHHAKLPCPKNLPTFQSFTESQAQEVSKSFPWCVWTIRHALLLGPWQDGWSKEGSISNSNLRNKQHHSIFFKEKTLVASQFSQINGKPSAIDEFWDIP